MELKTFGLSAEMWYMEQNAPLNMDKGALSIFTKEIRVCAEEQHTELISQKD